MASTRVVHVRPEGAAAERLRKHVDQIHAELEVTPDFPEEVVSAAEKAAESPRLPDLDRTDLPFVTIDPPTARDLDQALHIGRDGEGYVVSYAIADLAAFVTAGDAVDREAHRRGQTLYGADSKIPLHPKAISEDAGSLLAGEVRPAALWTITLDAAGVQKAARVERALVRSTAQLSYEDAQRQLDDGAAVETLALLAEVGPRRIAIEAERGGISLPLPDQEIVVTEDGRWDLSFRSLLPVEQWNAQISLLTGFAAAQMMLETNVGILRTLPPADPRDVERLRRTAKALRIDWPAELDSDDFIRSLDPTRPAHAAMLVASTRLLRGSGYAAFDGAPPEQPLHAGLAAPYAHVTAPLRRLVDRYGTEICLAHCAGEPVPGWVRDALPDLPGTMRDTGRLAGRYERMVLDLLEAGLLHRRVGETFAGVVTDVDEGERKRGTVTLEEPAVEAPVVAERGELPLGTEVSVELVLADVEQRKVQFVLR